MGRIRTIKPELFLHAELYDLEEETALPIRLSWIGLFTCCDREGRFKWKPRELKLQILPYDQVDFSRVLDALATRGLIVQYRVNDASYGFIPTWRAHQVINNRESDSTLPNPNKNQSIADASSTRDSRVNDTLATRKPREDYAASGEGKGREGKGREQKGKELSAARAKRNASDFEFEPEEPGDPDKSPAEPFSSQDQSESLERQEQFTEAGQEAQRENLASCLIPDNRPHVPHENPLAETETGALPSGEPEDEKQGATPPPNPQRPHHEALVKPKSAFTNAPSVSFDDWPKNGLGAWDAITCMIRDHHPRMNVSHMTITTVMGKIRKMVADRRYENSTAALEYLTARTKLYKECVADYPKNKLGQITGALNFYEGEMYDQDEQIWRSVNGNDRDEDDDRNRRRKEILLQLPEGGGADARPRGPVLVPGSPEYRARQAAIREAAMGHRRPDAGRRAF